MYKILSKIRATACMAFLCGVCFFAIEALHAQAPPGPLPPSHPLPPPQPAPPVKKKVQVAPRKTLAGYWKLNADESDDPRKKLDDARQTKAKSGNDPNGQGGPGSGGGGRVGVGFPTPGGGGPTGPNDPNGPNGGGGRGRELGGGDTDTSERLMQLVRPDYSQNVAVMDTELDATNDQGNKMVYYTDGRKIQKSKNDAVQEINAHWNGAQLVTDEKGPQGRKMTRTIELSPDGRQFYETWRIENGKSGTPIVIRYVFDAADEYAD